MFARFLHDRRANVIQIFALAIIPIIGFMGAAVDYSRMLAVRGGMQNALDATALYLSKESTSLTQEQLTAKATAHFNALFSRPEAKNVQVTSTLVTNAGMHTLTMNVKADVDATFTRIIGQTKSQVGSSAEVVWGIKRLELALALDNTGSMSSNSKMTELKKAAKNLVETLKAAAKNPEDVKIAVVPFDTTVNLGTSYKEAEWLNFNTIGSWHWSWSNGWTWTPGNKNSWEGCLMDRDQDFDVSDASPTSANPSTYFPAANCGSLTTMLPLTNDWNALNTKIDAMTPNGNTNVTIGLVWGWHALTSSVPFTQGAAPQSDLDKVVILLTDGENTQNRWSGTASQIDARTKKACTNIKAAGIKLYTVRVINGNATLLKDCASSPTMYFDVQESSQLNIVFGTIAKNLANLRIVK